MLNVIEAIHDGMSLSSSDSHYIPEKGSALMEPAFKCGKIPHLTIRMT